MSKYSEYAKKVDEIAKTNFAAYVKAKDAFEDEDKKFNDPYRYAEHDRKYNVTHEEKEARYLNAKADHVRLKEKFDNARKTMQNGVEEIASIRKNLAMDIKNDMRARPEDMDTNAIELLKSGILQPHEYQDLLRDFKGNPTMTRMIGSYAKQAATEADKQGNHNARALLLNVEYESRQMDGSEYLKAFDYLADVYRRAANNPYMIKHWDELTARCVDNF